MPNKKNLDLRRIIPIDNAFSFGYRNHDGSKTVYEIPTEGLLVSLEVVDFLEVNVRDFPPFTVLEA